MKILSFNEKDRIRSAIFLLMVKGKGKGFLSLLVFHGLK